MTDGTRRLCMVLHGPFPPDPRVFRAASTAVSLGWEVDVLAMRHPGQPAVEHIAGARVLRLPVAHRWGATPMRVVREYVGFTLLASMRAARLAAKRRYDVVHVHNPPDFLVAAALAPKLFGSRIILDIHDLAPEMFAMRFGSRPGSRAVGRMLRIVERLAAGFADAVITVHEPYRRELTRRGVPAGKVTVVMNSVDERLLPQPTRAPPADGFRVVYQGTVTPPYGVELLVEAAATLALDFNDLRVEIYGDGDELPRIRARAESLGLSGHVLLSGRFLPHADVLARVQSASVGVIPNLPTPLNRFALSTKLFEYVALRIPVVSADLPTIREHFDETELLFFKAGDAKSLASALRDVRENPSAAAERAEAALRRYEDYRWAANARRYADLLDALTT